ncbi:MULTISPECIES: energy transducer TonB [unclassified Chryseobacterium]|uniref:energy transducer TonB n=1 Tax=unclassified Chryseobacterium TaxID=2593645 RepID=UPI00226A7D45|nr:MULTISPECIES: energy transducer TonB [unclassified Chryseobacterium]
MKQLETNQEFRFNEILFEHRNKEYGAYVLRNESDKILTKALFIGVSLLAAISISPFVISAFEQEEARVTVEPVYRPVIIDDTPLEKDPPKEIVKPVQPVAPPNVKQFDSSVPEPTKDAIEKPVEKIPEDAVAGLTNNFKGEPVKDIYIPPAPTIGTGPAVPQIPVAQPPKIDKNAIVGGSELAVEASFEGGINSFRTKVMNNFDGSGIEGNGDVLKTTVTFIVEIDGTISGIKANGADADFNSEAMRTIKSISNKGKWKPGKNKQGESVRSYFKFPISMQFE